MNFLPVISINFKNNVLFFAVLFVLFTGCSSDDENFEPIEVSTLLIGKGNLYGNGSENIIQQNLILSNPNSWNQLIVQIDNINITDNFTEIDIDFSEYLVIAIFDEIKSNGGHSIDITGVTEFEDKISVQIKNILQGDATLVITQPYHIIKIARNNNKPIVFN
ncbi:protease complex subunit PrcB family protein [Psychroserpens sp.]